MILSYDQPYLAQNQNPMESNRANAETCKDEMMSAKLAIPRDSCAGHPPFGIEGCGERSKLAHASEELSRWCPRAHLHSTHASSPSCAHVDCPPVNYETRTFHVGATSWYSECSWRTNKKLPTSSKHPLRQSVTITSMPCDRKRMQVGDIFPRVVQSPPKNANSCCAIQWF